MRLYPAIDIKNGMCVRLIQGREKDKTIYGDDPAAMAQKFQSEGAQHLHVVDLDGAFTGSGANLEWVKAICRAVSIPVQLGGGIRTLEDIQSRLEAGVERVIIGTAAIENDGMVAQACKRFPGRIVAGIDAKDGLVAVKGWVETSGVTPVSLALRLKDLGVSVCVYTDISRDGMLSGPNFSAIQALMEQTGMEIIASGGISSLDDLLRLKELRIYGAITGKALYDGRIDLKAAISALK